MPIPIPNINFNQVVRHPVVYLLMLTGTACGFLLNQFVTSKKDQNNDCKTELVYFKNALNTERSINLQITNSLIGERRNFENYKDSTYKQMLHTKQVLVKKSTKLLKK